MRRLLRDRQAGYSMIEVLVAMFLTNIFIGLALAGIFAVRQTYLEDVARLRVNSNLRSAMDIVSMNVRQAGENLGSTFPVLTVEDGGSTAPDILTLRRNLIPEVLTLCVDASVGNTTLYVSDNTSSDTVCIPGNVASVFSEFETYRTTSSETVRLYVYDRISGVGEFVEYNEEDLSGSDHYLTVAALENNYPAATTNIYVLEEYLFEVTTSDETLDLYQNGERDDYQAVAFEITDFQVSLEMDDGTTITSFDSSSSYNWQEIQQVVLTITGQDTWKDTTITSSLTAEYFPRNVLST